MKQHTVTRLSAAFLLDSRPKFPDQFSVVNTGNSLASLQVANHQHPLTIPEYQRHDFASRDNHAKLYWRRRSDMCKVGAFVLGVANLCLTARTLTTGDRPAGPAGSSL